MTEQYSYVVFFYFASWHYGGNLSQPRELRQPSE